jgi:hypothetical protein
MKRPVIGIVLLFMLPFTSIAYQMPAAEAFCISPYGADYMQALAEGQNLYVLWEYNIEGSVDQVGDHYLQFAASADGGRTFSAPVNIYRTDPLCGLHARLSANGEFVYIMWEDREKIYVKGSSDAGRTFHETVTLGEGNIGDMGRVGPLDGGRVLADGNRAYVIWTGWDGIYFSRTEDGGASFSTPVNLSMDEAFEPRIASYGDNVYVAWVQQVIDERCLDQCDHHLMFAYSHDYGETFSEPENLEDLTGSELSAPDYPIISTYGNNVYLLWKEDYWNLFSAVSNDGGATFLQKQRITDFAETESGYPVLFSAYEDGAYLMWQSREGRNAFLRITNGGHEFTEVNGAIPTSFAPLPGMLLMSNGGKAYFMWPEYPANDQKEVWFAPVLTGSDESPEPVVLAQYSAGRPFVDLWMAASGDFVHVLWIESNGPPSDYQQRLLVRTSTDSGRSFGDDVVVSSMVTVPEFSSVATLLMTAGIIGSIVAARRFKQYNRKS